MHKNTLRFFSCMTSGACFALFAVSTLQAQVSVKDTQTAYGREITLANEFISASFLPDWGGRMNKLVDLKSGVNMVFWDYPPDDPKWGGGWGGALDDRNGWNIKYDGAIIEQNPQTAALALKSPRSEQGIVCEKIIRLAAHSSCLQVEYRYTNHGQKETGSYMLAIRNFFRPSGGPPDWTSEHAFVPSIKAVRELGGDQRPYPELTGKFMTEIIPTWNGFLDKKAQRGLAFAFDDDFFRWLYRWIKAESATYEWTFSPVPPGKEAITRFTIAVTRGLDGYMDAAETYAANMSWKQTANAIEVAYGLCPTMENLNEVTVKTTLLSPARKPLRALPDIRIGKAAVGETAHGKATWDVVPDKGRILAQSVYSGPRLLGEYEIPASFDAPAPDYARAKKGRRPVTMKDIPGWTAVSNVSVAPSAADTDRGYMVYRDYFAPTETERGKDTSEIRMDLGQDEFESLAVVVKTLKNTGPFTVSSDNDRVGIRIESRETIPEAVQAGKEGIAGYKLNLTNTFTPETGKDTTVWLTWDGRGLKPGAHRATVTFTPRNTASKTISLIVKTRTIRLPERNIFQFETEGDIFQVFAQKYGWNVEKILPYIRDLGNHRVNIAQVFSGLEAALPADKVKVWNNGITLKEALAQNPKLAAEQPALDFSWFDPWFDAMIEAGLVRAYTRQSGAKERTPEEKWRMAELAKYLGEKGYPYRDRFVKFVDEQPPEEFPRMAAIGEVYHQLGWRVLHTSSPINSSAQMRILNPSSDLWHGAMPRKEDVEARRKEGALDPGDEIWTYDGWGASWKSYASRRSLFWNTCAHGLDGLHLHVYYRGSMMDALIYPTPEGPVASAAWEGARDGAEDVQYLALVRQWLNSLRDTDLPGQMRETLPKRLADVKQAMQKPGERTCAEIISARTACLDMLEELAPYERKGRITVLYGFEPLVLDGVPRYILAGDARARETVEKTLAPLCREQMRSASWEKIAGEKDLADNVLLLLAADHPFCGKLAADGAIPMSASCPAAGSYAIWEAANPASPKSKLLLIVGRDAAGLQKGCNNFLRFLRIEPQPF